MVFGRVEFDVGLDGIDVRVVNVVREHSHNVRDIGGF
jgi:hypothetical protein